MKRPWETAEGRVIWKTEAQYWTWLRGALRQLWSDYPLRKEWKKRQARPVTSEERLRRVYHPSTKNVAQCSFCKEWMAISNLECDHLVESRGCTSKDTAEDFLWHCGGLIGEDFRLACKPCHKIQSYSQRSGESFEDAKNTKTAIAIQKTKNDKEWLQSKGVKPAGNAAARREQIIEVLRNGT